MGLISTSKMLAIFKIYFYKQKEVYGFIKL